MDTLLADLHVHTTVSDGSLAPREVVNLALELGLKAIAITDHDTVAGVDQACQAAVGTPLIVVPGVEISCEDEGREVHILGYYPRPIPEFISRLKEFAVARLERMTRIVEKLAGLGIKVDMKDINAQAGKGTVGRPHVAAVLVQSGIVGSVEEAFIRFLGKNAPAFVPRAKFRPADAVGFLLQCGGVPVIAHPGLIGDDRVIGELVTCGLAGIEVYHPRHDRDAQRHYLEIAKRYGLVVTGGSDFHGPGHNAGLGEVTVPYSTVQSLYGCRRESKKAPAGIKYK